MLTLQNPSNITEGIQDLVKCSYSRHPLNTHIEILMRFWDLKSLQNSELEASFGEGLTMSHD